MIKKDLTCSVCGRVDENKEKAQFNYDRQLCPFCRREEKWNSWKLEKQFPGLTARQYDEIENLPKVNSNNIPESIFCHGPSGTGKTSFVIRMLYDRRSKAYINGHKFYLTILKTSELNDELINYSKKEVLDKYRHAHILFIDDIGVDKDNQWLYQNLYNIIDYRYEWLKPLIVTSNLSLKELAFHWNDHRITRRIAAICQPIKFTKVYDKT